VVVTDIFSGSLRSPVRLITITLFWHNMRVHWMATPQDCCDRKSRAAYAQSFAPWHQATIEISQRDHSIIACLRQTHISCSSRTSRSWWITQSTQHRRRGCNSTILHEGLPCFCSRSGSFPVFCNCRFVQQTIDLSMVGVARKFFSWMCCYINAS